ncbi:MAG: mannose-1-phosphate guanylyltransferase/mannose-6-phosphate isomerase [Pseudomonadota bacterium]
MKLIPVVLSGGAGTRLWPLSRQSKPKQMLDLLGAGQTLMQQTLKRVSGDDFAQPIVLGNVHHEALIKEQLSQISMTADIVLEPEARNTAPAIALAVAFALEQDPGAALIVLPSDHVIEDEAAFVKAVKQASAAADDQRLITFGISPHKPETGFGYIEMGNDLPELNNVNALSRFVEKPDERTAKQYIAAGNFVWNAGMFLFKASAAARAFKAHAPDCLAACEAALKASDTRGNSIMPERKAFQKAPAISFDYAIMEKISTGAVVPCDIGWSDVGSFEGLWEVLPKDASGNATIGDVTLLDCRDCLAFCDGPAITMTGLDGQVIISSGDVVTVLPKSQSQNVKALRQHLADQNRPEAIRFASDNT